MKLALGGGATTNQCTRVHSILTCTEHTQSVEVDTVPWCSVLASAVYVSATEAQQLADAQHACTRVFNLATFLAAQQQAGQPSLLQAVAAEGHLEVQNFVVSVVDAQVPTARSLHLVQAVACDNGGGLPASRAGGVIHYLYCDRAGILHLSSSAMCRWLADSSMPCS